MRIGVILPSFAKRADESIRVAQLCEANGIHGVFCYDHLWPLGEPGRPAISPFPLLGALSEKTSAIALGTLVARVGLVPNNVLISELSTIHEMANGRFIAAIGTGDHKSAQENLAYGVPFAPAHERRASLRSIATQLEALEMDVWIGGGAPQTNVIARETHATLNLWAATPAQVAVEAEHASVSWAGRFHGPAKAAEQLTKLHAAGATWAVYIWPDSLDPVLRAVAEAGLSLGA